MHTIMIHFMSAIRMSIDAEFRFIGIPYRVIGHEFSHNWAHTKLIHFLSFSTAHLKPRMFHFCFLI